MKLTIRYLLAYLDDVLKPSDAAKVGRLVKQSPKAMELIKKIETVIRQRRLSAPLPQDQSPGTDANEVAEYLDNLTPAEQLTVYESSLLNSDVRLAEVAATHQILSQFLGGAPEIPATTRNKLQEIALSFLPQDAEWNEDNDPASEVEIPAMVAPTFGASAPEIAIPFEIPRQQGSWKQFMIILAVVVLLGGWAASILTDPSFKDASEAYVERRFDPVNTDPDASNAVAPPVANTSEPVTVSPTPASTSMTEIAAVTPITTAIPTSTSAVPPTNPPMVNTPPAVVVDPKETTPPPASTSEPLRYMQEFVSVSKPLELIHIHEATTPGLAVLTPALTVFHKEDRLLVPPFSVASVEVNGGAAQIQIHQNSSVQLMGSIEEDGLGFDIERGRLLIDMIPEGSADPIKLLEVRIAGKTWNIRLPAERLRLAFEVELLAATGFELIPPEGLTRAHIWVDGGAIQLSESNQPPVEVKGYHELLPQLPADEAEQDLTAQLPPWFEGDPFSMTLSQRRDQQEFHGKIEGSNNLWLDLQGIANDPNARIAELATQLLALGEQYESLVTILARSPHEESRTQAILGLRQWMPRNIDSKEKLKEVLDITFTPGTAQSVYELLWGFQREDGKRPDISRRLVDYLRHEHIAVRELAIYWIYELTGQRLNYRPLAVASTREQAVTSWEKHLNRVGALIDPESK